MTGRCDSEDSVLVISTEVESGTFLSGGITLNSSQCMHESVCFDKVLGVQKKPKPKAMKDHVTILPFAIITAQEVKKEKVFSPPFFLTVRITVQLSQRNV